MNALKTGTLWIIILLLLFLAVDNWPRGSEVKELELSRFMDLARSGAVIKLTDKGGEIVGEYRQRQQGQNNTITDVVTRFRTKYNPGQEAFVLSTLLEMGVPYNAEPSSRFLTGLLLTILVPLAFILLFWFIILRPIQGSGNKAMSFGKSRARLVTDSQNKVTFGDVAGVEEAKQELEEVVEFLKDPQKFKRLGANIPKGVLLVGPPGTGKTLLAKAVAGEANVPFFSISGSDFVEMFVGVGASRVRDLFEQGKKHKPCLIFIDEIDAVGRHRGAGLGGGHDEREQTLNQLLVEMDGFASNEGVILIAATNRPDVLDPALLRPGRFDRQVTVDLPDVLGREHILRVHLKKIQLSRDIDIERLSKASSGFSGADLANMVNEAALLAGRRGKERVDMNDLEEARDRVMMGPERKSLKVDADNRRLVALHEAGHALCSKFTPGSDPVHKVTVIPRGRALGLTSYLPERDVYNLEFRREMKGRLVSIMGGRAAEEIVYEGEFTAGASGDIQQATRLCLAMVCDMGMSSALGPRAYGEGSSQIFLGRSMARDRNFSEETARQIDEEVRKMIDEAHQGALRILTENRALLERVADVLIERETITGAELDLLIAGKDLPPLPKVVVEPDEKPTAPTEAEDEKPAFQPKTPSIFDRPREMPG